MAAPVARTITAVITPPPDKEPLLLEGFTGTEAISQPFQFDLHFVAEMKAAIPFEKLLGQKATIHMVLADGKKSYLHGVIHRVGQDWESGGADEPTLASCIRRRRGCSRRVARARKRRAAANRPVASVRPGG